MAHGADSPEIYTPAYYDRIAVVESQHWWHLGMQNIALALLTSGGRRAYERVLDAGCGTGGMMRWAQEKLSAHEIHGVDIAPEGLAYCKARNPEWRVREASVLDLPYPEHAFDLVISNDVLQHLPTDGGDALGLREMARVLAPGGALLLRTNSRLGMWQKPDAKDADYQRYLIEEVIAEIEAAGLTIFRATYANFLGSLHESLRRLLRGRSHQAQHAHHHHGEASGRSVYEGLQIRDTAARHPFINRILRWVLNCEAHYLAKPRRSLSFGHAIVVVALKPGA
jgi:SAM-dependent methyltransferase